MADSEEPRPGNHDRAWNDPPLFSYKPDPQAVSTGLKLNKRVMYPAGQPQQGPSPGESIIDAPRLHDAGARRVDAIMLPPPPSVKSSSLPPTTSTVTSGTSTGPKPGREVTDEDCDRCLSTMAQLTQRLESQIESRKMADIRKRLAIMETKLMDKTLEGPIMQGLLTLSEAVAASQWDEAERIQKKIVVDWPQCGTWLIAIKHLILEAKTADETAHD